MSTDQTMRAVVERIEMLVEEFARSPYPAVARKAQELVQSLMRLYGAGVERMLRIIELHDGTAGRTRDAMLDDDLVASLLVLHDLHPDDVETRIRRGLERLRAPVGARISLLEVREGAARVHVEDERGSLSALDVQGLIEGVVRAVAPDVAVVEIEGLPARPEAPLIQLARKPPAERPDEISTR